MDNQIDGKDELKKRNWSGWYDKHYKTLLAIPILIMILSLAYLGYFYSQNQDIMLKDSSLSGGSTITLNGDIDSVSLESFLSSKFPDLSIRKLTDITTGRTNALILETSAPPDAIKPEIEKFLGYKLTDENSSFEFTGPSLSESFYKQLLIALLISFVLMSLVVFFSFKTFVPSLAVIFAAFADIVMPLALIDFLGIRISAAGISAFLMLIGYSVDTDILLTSRALRKKGGALNKRIFGAFKTGSFMTITALIAVLPAFFIVSNLPDSFRQIFFILALGLFADLINTWLTNASIIKWYCTKRRIE
ncbi:MAG: protein translocase subunit SecF [Candidatus Nanoarchaeia archaeon]|nr:protein translocase subunit SecF [Candidatus Nanoarchaeia archaeon]